MSGDRDRDAGGAAALDTAGVADALDGVRRRLRAHAGDVEVVSVSDGGEVTLAFAGNCIKCPAQAMTFGASILPVVEGLPGVSRVSMHNLSVSDAALRRIRAMFGGRSG